MNANMKDLFVIKLPVQGEAGILTTRIILTDTRIGGAYMPKVFGKPTAEMVASLTGGTIIPYPEWVVSNL